MAPPFVEANSLSEITQLASNPPKYPRNPTERKRNPLTLYIARVPGSRDVILTTLKPQLKNVTVQDVASSLYYLHLNTEDDARLLAEDQAIPGNEGSATASETAPMQTPLARKPLPENARPSLEISSRTDRRFVRQESPTRPVPVGTKVQGMNNMQDTIPLKTSVPRRPLGPRPPVSESAAGRKPLPGVENRPSRSGQGSVFDVNASGQAIKTPTSQHLNSEKTNKMESPNNTFSITIIRRDPSSGAQWNVGSIYGHPTREGSQDQGSRGSSRSKKNYFDMSINLPTPGYTKFRSLHTPNHPDDGFVAETPQNLSSNSNGFERQLYMEGSGFWSRSSMQHRRTLSDMSDQNVTARGRSYSSGSTIGNSKTVTNEPPERDSSEKGYLFLSPWGGRCKFSTGSGGRTLRCKHTIPSQGSAVVSELRFNLPSVAVFSSSSSSAAAVGSKETVKDSKLFSIAKFGHRRKKPSVDNNGPPLPPRLHPTSYAAMYPSDGEEPPAVPPKLNPVLSPESSDEADSYARSSFQSLRGSTAPDSYADDRRLDMSIGQEKAGGGNKGKRAKLGKLIIDDEGFKMLDLVVSANMAIWWSRTADPVCNSQAGNPACCNQKIEQQDAPDIFKTLLSILGLQGVTGATAIGMSCTSLVGIVGSVSTCSGGNVVCCQESQVANSFSPGVLGVLDGVNILNNFCPVIAV
ncbi:hypothetical protein G7Y89_g12194 [Cudoniella acicularis]|uniref:Hydrophobin n=1 Tax=Cudoniella acicularis TaxID=354080 RepID=A0A8H4RBP5_9HELO|nr:hypothetical protein G7Y89_g12194 [Cudoniella acicularis]